MTLRPSRVAALLTLLGAACTRAPGQDLQVDPNPVYFGTVALTTVIGIASSESVTLSNPTDRWLSVDTISLADDGGGVFTLDAGADAVPIALDPGSEPVSINVGVMGSAAEGQHSGVLRFDVTSASDGSGGGAESQVTDVELSVTTTR